MGAQHPGTPPRAPCSNPRYIDRNYGGVLIVFDRLFGTFQAERDDEPPRYGLAGRPRIDNPLWLALSEWRLLARTTPASLSSTI